VSDSGAGRVVVFELNEITWDLIDPLLERGLLPNFRAMMEGGVRGEPWASEEEGYLEPWVAWTTVYTGVPQREHRLWMLEQDRETLGAKRLWEYLREAGVRLGLFGSANSWPPEPVEGFWVPGPFSRDFATYPAELEPVQALNVGLTRGHTVGAAKRPRLASLVPHLLRLGLSLPTIVRLAQSMVEMRLKPAMRWKMVSLQPLLNLDLFAHLYRAYRPQFATFHSNHCAYYQHRFWRAMDPGRFDVPPTPEERATYGGCIEHGYRIADQVLGRLRRIIGPDANLVVLSSCGQQPATGGRYSEDHRQGHVCLQIRIETLLDCLGIADQVRYSNLMAPHWKVDFDSENLREETVTALRQARNCTRSRPAFEVTVEGNSICLSTYRDQELDDTIELLTPAGPRQFRAADLLDEHAEVAKSGRHHPKGVLLAQGPAVRRNFRIPQCDNLDLAPTLLRLLGQPVPRAMHGRVLEEAFHPASAGAALVPA
jgi:hypothetical protein